MAISTAALRGTPELVNGMYVVSFGNRTFEMDTSDGSMRYADYSILYNISLGIEIPSPENCRSIAEDFLELHDLLPEEAVFAGVSSWYLYYIGSDSRHTVHLKGTPFSPEARDAYLKSAPIAAIENANTPMLLQHGEKDERITVVSSQEMYRSLKDKGIHTELIVFPGKGHGFIQPRENYAVGLHEYRWFCHYLLGEELDLFKDDL